MTDVELDVQYALKRHPKTAEWTLQDNGRWAHPDISLPVASSFMMSQLDIVINHAFMAELPYDDDGIDSPAPLSGDEKFIYALTEIILGDRFVALTAEQTLKLVHSTVDQQLAAYRKAGEKS